jgi:hypothetical protein
MMTPLTLEEMREMAKPRPHIYGTIFLNCGGCATPKVEIYQRDTNNGEYCLLIGHEVFIYLDRQQLNDLVDDIDMKRRAVLDEG